MIRRVLQSPGVVCILLFLSAALVWYFELWHTSDLVADKMKAIGILGTLVAAAWTLYLFLLRGSFETSLAMDFSIATQARGEQFVVFLQITLENIGGRRITAPPALSTKQIADYENSVEFPCDLQVLALREQTSGPRFVGWWSKRDRPLSEIPGIPIHISVLYEYTRSDQSVDFFMEPGEKYVLGKIFILPPGHYAAKLVFVGERATAAEFWSRIFYFFVPASIEISAEVHPAVDVKNKKLNSQASS